MKEIKWVPSRDARPDGLLCRMYGAGVKGKATQAWEGQACFSSWHVTRYDTIVYRPMYHKPAWPDEADPIFRYAINKVVRKIFPAIPYYSKLRKGDVSLSFDVGKDDWSYTDLNFMLRVVRAMHEQPSVLSSCYHIHNLYPDLEAPWILGLAACGSWDYKGKVSSHVTFSHCTFDNPTSMALGRTFHHCAGNGGKMGAHYGQDSRYRYYGVSGSAEGGLFPVKIPDTLSRAMHRPGADYKRIYNGELLAAMMTEVRKQHLEGKKQVSLTKAQFKDFIPKDNEDAARNRIW